MLIGVAMNYFLPAQVFVIATSISSFACMITWSLILFSQMSYRKSLSPEQRKSIRYKMPLSPYSNYFALLFFVVVVISAPSTPRRASPFLRTIVWVAALLLVYYGTGVHKAEKIRFEHYKGDAVDPSNR